MDPFTQIGWFVRWKPPLFTQSMKTQIDSVGVCAPRINTKTSKSVSVQSPVFNESLPTLDNEHPSVGSTLRPTRVGRSLSLASPSGVGDTGQLITHHNKSYTCTVFVLYIYYIIKYKYTRYRIYIYNIHIIYNINL